MGKLKGLVNNYEELQMKYEALLAEVTRLRKDKRELTSRLHALENSMK